MNVDTPIEPLHADPPTNPDKPESDVGTKPGDRSGQVKAPDTLIEPLHADPLPNPDPPESDNKDPKGDRNQPVKPRPKS